jgi:hypothetical protein
LAVPIFFFITLRNGQRKHHSFTYGNRFRGNLLTDNFPSSGCLLCLIKDLLPSNGRRSVVSTLLPRNECYFRTVR